MITFIGLIILILFLFGLCVFAYGMIKNRSEALTLGTFVYVISGLALIIH